MGFGGLELGVEDVDDDRSSVVVVEGVSLVVGEASVEVSVGVGVGESTGGPRGRGAPPRGAGAPPTLMERWWAPWPSSFAGIFLIF